jgi:hypothetical protein
MNLSEYNNNPGNLRPPKGVTYEGQIGVDEHGFAVFEKPEYGRKALIQDIKIKIDKGLTTPHAFIDKYTPAGDENSEDVRDTAKIRIANHLGLDNTKANFPENSAEKIAEILTSIESGKPITPKEKKEAENAKTVTQTSPDYLGGVGAVTGAAVGAKIRAGQAIYNKFWGNKDASGEVRSNPIHPSERLEPVVGELSIAKSPVAAIADEPIAPLESSIQNVRIMQGGQGDTLGTTGRARQEGYNADTAQRAAVKSEMEKITPQAKQILAKMPGMTSTPSGVLIPRTEPRPTAGPRPQPSALKVRGGVPFTPSTGNLVDLDSFGAFRPSSDIVSDVIPPAAEPVIPKSPLPVQPSVGENIGNKLMGALSYFSLPAKLAMTGYEAGFGAQDVQNKLQNKDKKGATMSAIEHGSLAASPWMADAAALAAKAGLPRLAAVTSPLGLAIPAGWTLYDVYKNSYLPVSSAQAQANLAKQYPDNTGNPYLGP